MVLNGWKEIAQHFRCGVRTVQRWECMGLGLPVHRPKQGTGPVCAFSEDLDDWLKNTPRRALVDAAPSDEQEALRHFRHRVLIADDNDTFLSTMAVRLKTAGYEVRTARDGFEALVVMREGGVPDLLISDLNMPHMSGFELLAVVRKRFPAIGVIAVSGDYSLANDASILADAFLDKGEDLSKDLVPVVQDVLSRSPIRAQVSKGEPVAWIPRSSTAYLVLTCTGCLRSFSVSTRDIPHGGAASDVCTHCGVTVGYRIDATAAHTAQPGARHRETQRDGNVQ
jgi:CheY-like chemotaxis protein